MSKTNTPLFQKLIDSIKVSDEFLESKNATKKGIAMLAERMLNDTRTGTGYKIMIEYEKELDPDIKFDIRQKDIIIRMLKTNQFISTCIAFEMITILLKSQAELTAEEKERLYELIVICRESKHE